jgi:hypothetical protein
VECLTTALNELEDIRDDIAAVLPADIHDHTDDSVSCADEQSSKPIRQRWTRQSCVDCMLRKVKCDVRTGEGYAWQISDRLGKDYAPILEMIRLAPGSVQSLSVAASAHSSDPISNAMSHAIGKRKQRRHDSIRVKGNDGMDSRDPDVIRGGAMPLGKGPADISEPNHNNSSSVDTANASPTGHAHDDDSVSHPIVPPEHDLMLFTATTNNTHPRVVLELRSSYEETSDHYKETFKHAHGRGTEGEILMSEIFCL